MTSTAETVDYLVFTTEGRPMLVRAEWILAVWPAGNDPDNKTIIQLGFHTPGPSTPDNWDQQFKAIRVDQSPVEVVDILSETVGTRFTGRAARCLRPNDLED